MESWKLVPDEDAFHFFASARANERRSLLSAFEELRLYPYRQADSHEGRNGTLPQCMGQATVLGYLLA